MWTVVLIAACLVHCLHKVGLHEILYHWLKVALSVYTLNRVIKCFECLIAFDWNSLTDLSLQERNSLAKIDYLNVKKYDESKILLKSF